MSADVKCADCERTLTTIEQYKSADGAIRCPSCYLAWNKAQAAPAQPRLPLVTPTPMDELLEKEGEK